MNLINFKKYYAQLVSALVEKLSDSKVVIRQAVLKCCSLIITVRFSFLTYKELQSKYLRFPCNEILIT